MGNGAGRGEGGGKKHHQPCTYIYVHRSWKGEKDSPITQREASHWEQTWTNVPFFQVHEREIINFPFPSLGPLRCCTLARTHSRLGRDTYLRTRAPEDNYVGVGPHVWLRTAGQGEPKPWLLFWGKFIGAPSPFFPCETWTPFLPPPTLLPSPPPPLST